MNKLSQYEKLFSRDFCLASVECWVRGESANPKGWTNETQPHLPYIITQRSDDTVHFYYDLQGIEWVTNSLSKIAHGDKNFLNIIEKTVLKKLEFIKPIYDKEKAISLSVLKRFLKELEEGYPWFEAMWWFCQMDEKKLIGLDLESIQKVRTLTDKLCNSSDTVIRESLLKSYPKLGDLSSVLTTKEIQTETIPLKAILVKRYKGYFFGDNQLFIDAKQSLIESIFNITFKQEIVEKVTFVKGRVAQQGYAKGYVRRVMGHKQIHEVREGEILVSPMTIPDFLPAMKKAAAYITDEGGILCHAAIVAREFKKPCIVGTGIATRVFKDGDFVEVDANKGIIRLIKD